LNLLSPLFYIFMLFFTSICKAQKPWKLVWSDEFNYQGLPDSTKWAYDVGGNGWGNNEKQYYTLADSRNVQVKNGVLTITAIKENRENIEYTSARLVTRGKAEWSHGKIEFRAKLPKGRGTWPAGWMLGSNINEVAWPQCGEIDVLEHVGYDPDTVVASFHSTAYNHMLGTQKTSRIFIKNPYTEFHTYACSWNKDEISFLLDGKPYLTVRNEYKTDKEWPFDKPFYALLDLAIGGNWGGTKGIDPTIFPAKFEIDYVRVYQR
jgi:beta-glucanase (GH16 family)